MRLRQFWSDRRGVAAVELALVAPIAAGLLVASYGLWSHASQQGETLAALDVGSRYYMNGGASDTAAQALTLAAWEGRPTNSAVTTQRNCYCGTNPLACSALCPNQQPPAVYVTLQATSTNPLDFYSQNIAAERVVRVR